MPEDLSPGPTSHSSRPVVVLGAGIVGLATALRILQHPKQLGEVHVVAAHLPGDPLSAEYASPAAGAHHLSFAADSDERQQGWDRRTFQIMMDEWSSLGEASGLMRIRQTECELTGTRAAAAARSRHLTSSSCSQITMAMRSIYRFWRSILM